MSLPEKDRTKVYYPRGYDKGRATLPPMSVSDLQFHYPDMFREVLATISPSKAKKNPESVGVLERGVLQFCVASCYAYTHV